MNQIENGQNDGAALVDDKEEKSKEGGGRRRGGRKTHRPSAVTRALGHLQSEKNPRGSWAVGLIYFKTNPGKENIMKVIEERLLTMVRFRSRLKMSRWGGKFVELNREEMDMDYHFHVEDETTPGDDSDKNSGWSIGKLLEYIGELNSFPFDITKPLWRFVFIPKLLDGRSCLIATINHAIGDGLSQVEILFSLLDRSKEPPPRHPGKRAKGPKLNWFTKSRIFLYGIHQGLVGTFGKQDPPNSLKLKDSRNPTPEKRVAQTDTIPLDKLKEIKNKFPGTTVNDILMALMTLTLFSYYSENNEKPKKVRGQFPISVRKRGASVLRDNEGSNQFAYGSFEFPFKILEKSGISGQDGDNNDGAAAPAGDSATMTELIWKIKLQTEKIKASPAPLVQNFLSKKLIYILPRKVYTNILMKASNISTGMLSNVPGPQSSISMAGVEVDDMSFFLFSPLGMYFGVMTYNGKCSAGVSLDGGMGVDPKDVTKHWLPNFDLLYSSIMAIEGDTAPMPSKTCC